MKVKEILVVTMGAEVGPHYLLRWEKGFFATLKKCASSRSIPRNLRHTANDPTCIEATRRFEQDVASC